jgi:Bifunctional DNA primase/polymerase, N-terminal
MPVDAEQERPNTETCRQAARRYIARGWKPLLVRRGNKGPRETGWPQWQVGDDAEAYIKERFAGVPLANVAVQLGAMSGGLTDVDLESNVGRAAHRRRR